MLFNSVHFLFFFPLVVLGYFVLPQRLRWVWLLLASYYFYMAWNPRYALLLAASTLITYASGRLIGREGARRKKLWVALSFTSNLAILFLFKYFHFALDSLNGVLAALGIAMLHPAFDVLLPVGISFYTFQALSYTVDVYRGDIAPVKNLGKYALFVSFFPQLVAGPVERSPSLLPQFSRAHSFEYARVRDGLIRMAWGFFEKMVIADRAAILVNRVYGEYAECSGAHIAAATLLFALQIYCDFSGYSDIAIGAAKVMGFELMENFRQPYFARSIRDFWSRWHISLSTWFRDYLYIPLGGGRAGRPRRYFNVLVTFLVSGLWHGAAWTYVAWGGLHGVYQIAGDALRPLRSRLAEKAKINTGAFSYRLAQRLVTFALVCFAWIFFRAPGMNAALEMIRRLFTAFDYGTLFDGTLLSFGLSALDIAVLATGVLAVFIVSLMRSRGRSVGAALAGQNAWFRWLCYAGIVLAVLLFGVYGSGYAQSQFIYFQF